MFWKRYSLYFAWLISLLAVLLSLYLSEVRKIEPCHLCWYQRIAIFPLIFVLGIAVYREFFGIAIYVLPQVIVGFLFALYQVAIQEIPGFHPIDICGGGPKCTDKFSIGLGPISLPMVSSAGLLALIVLLLMSFFLNRKNQHMD